MNSIMHNGLQNSQRRSDRRRCGCWLVFASLSWLFLTGSTAMARDESDEEEAAPAVGERQFIISEQQFDQMVFGGQQTAQKRVVVQRANGEQVVGFQTEVVSQASVVDFRKRMEAIAVAVIEVVDRRVSLTDAQKKKLKLAARGDIEQVVARAAELRPKLTSKPMNQQQYVDLMRELQPLRMTQQFGVTGENSLFRKTLRHLLNDEQRVRWQELERERQRTVVESAIQTWERMANGAKIPVASRKEFVEILVEHGDLPETQNSYIIYVVLVEAGKLEDRLKPLLHEDVWEKLRIQIGHAKQIEATLRRSGQWLARAADDDVPDSKNDGAKD